MEPLSKKPRTDSPPVAFDPSQLAAQIAEKKRKLQEQLQASGIAPLPSGKDGSVMGTAATSGGNAVDVARLARERAQQIAARLMPAGVPPAAPVPVASVEQKRKGPVNLFAPHQSSNNAIHNSVTSKKGLYAEIHPALVMNKETGALDIKRDSGISLVPKFATTKANLRAAQHLDAKPAATASAADQVPDITKEQFFDPNLGGGKYATPDALMIRPRTVRQGFKFVQKGTFVSQANQMRAQARLERLRAEIADNVKKAGLEQELELVGDGAVKHDDVPDVEWWDTQFLPSMNYADLDKGTLLLNEDTMTNLIQHPVPIEPTYEDHSTYVAPVILTKRERKKARRLRRLAEQKELQEKIRLGLLPPELPKMKLSNFMRVLGNEAVLDPTKAEKLVRQQVQKRSEDHHRANEERKLTEEQRKEKKRKKYEEDTSHMVHVALFRVLNLSHPSHRFKVDTNAQQNNLTGVCIAHNDCNLIVVEGGPKGIKRYKNLMLRRINWNEKADPVVDGSSVAADDPSKANVENECVLVWEGMVKVGNFRGFRFKVCPTEARAKEMLGEACAHYYDMAKNYDSGKSI